MPFPFSHSIDFHATIDDSEYVFEIGYNWGDVWSPTDDAEYGVQDWGVVKIDGKPNMLGDFWAEQLDEFDVEEAIIEQETA